MDWHYVSPMSELSKFNGKILSESPPSRAYWHNPVRADQQFDMLCGHVIPLQWVCAQVQRTVSKKDEGVGLRKRRYRFFLAWTFWAMTNKVLL